MPEVLNRLGEKMKYRWTFCLFHSGKTKIVHAVNFIACWKPILIFQKAPIKKSLLAMSDVIRGGRRQKENHDWEQDSTAIRYLLKNFSNENDLICDPFSGAGTVAKACKEMNRNFIGAEIEKRTYDISKHNINEPKMCA